MFVYLVANEGAYNEVDVLIFYSSSCCFRIDRTTSKHDYVNGRARWRQEDDYVCVLDVVRVDISSANAERDSIGFKGEESYDIFENILHNPFRQNPSSGEHGSGQESKSNSTAIRGAPVR